MAMFGALDAAGSALGVYRTWLDALSDNISNINTARPTSQPAFQARYVVAQSAVVAPGQGGTEVAGIALGSATGREVFDPSNPLADKQGMVRYPDIDLGEQMGQLIMAQRGYEVNLAVVDRAKEAYQQALQLGH
jgi:flagellar basal-body rod protein FlgC